MIPPTENVQNRPIYQEIKSTAGCLGRGVGPQAMGVTASGYKVSFWKSNLYDM